MHIKKTSGVKRKNRLYSLMKSHKVKKILKEHQLSHNQYLEFNRLVLQYENKLNNLVLEINQAESTLTERKSNLELLRMMKKEGKLNEKQAGSLLHVRHDLSKQNIRRILKPVKENLKILKKQHHEMLKNFDNQLISFIKIVRLQTELLPFSHQQNQ